MKYETSKGPETLSNGNEIEVIVFGVSPMTVWRALNG